MVRKYLPPAYFKVILLWLAWIAILFAWQELVPARFDILRPDNVLDWTASHTYAPVLQDRPFLANPFLNSHVAYDSEFYLQQTIGGHDDPRVRTIPGPGPGGNVSLSYAFFPLYGFLTRLVSFPLQIFGANEISTATVAGLLVSLLGTLAGMLALARLAGDQQQDSSGFRAAFYLVIFPTGFFLGQVYSEGLFIGLAFWSLLLARRGQPVWAGILAALAVWTRAVGVLLILPLAWHLFYQVRSLNQQKFMINKPLALSLIGVLSPLISFAGFWFSILGERFRYVEEHFFRVGFLNVQDSLSNFTAAWATISGSNPQSSVFQAIDFFILFLSLALTIWQAHNHPDLALFSLGVWMVSAFGGQVYSIGRYLLVMPIIYLGLARLGRIPVFDRAWSLGSTLLMGLLSALFSFNFWVG